MKKKKTEFEKSPMAELARRLNVEPEYINAAHKPVVIRPGVIRAVLSAMGYRLENDLDALAWLKRLDHTECERTLPPVLVLRHELQPAHIPVNVVPESHSHNWRLVREDGEVAEEGSLEIRRSTASNHETADEDGFGTSSVALKVELPCGYHRFQFDDESMPLIVVPAT